jgi:hypothetical protein
MFVGKIASLPCPVASYINAGISGMDLRRNSTIWQRTANAKMGAHLA